MHHPRLCSATGPPNLRETRLKAFLNAFSNCLKDYNELRKYRKKGKKDRRDVAYWYGERTLTGLFSGAVWRMKGERWALEEFKSLRHVGRKKKGGRGDLWFGLSAQMNYTVESKVYEEFSPKILRDHEWVCRKVQKKLNDAFNQLGHLRQLYRVGQPMAACFIVPYFRKSNSASHHIGRFFRRITRYDKWRRSETAVGAFWYEKGILSCLDNSVSPGRYYVAPGIIVVLQWQQKFPQRSKRRR